MKNKVNILVATKWAGQSAEDARKEHEGKDKISSTELAAFTVGFRKGFMQAVALLKLHGFIETEAK